MRLRECFARLPAEAPEARRQLSEPFVRECPSRSGFQIAFKIDRLLMVRERKIGHQPPRPEFGSVRRIAGVVCREPRSQITRQPDVALFRVRNALKEVYVLHMQWPVFALRASPGSLRDRGWLAGRSAGGAKAGGR